MDSFKQRFVNASVLNEKDIEKIIGKKLSINGKLDATILRTATEDASKDKLKRIDYILRNTTVDQTAILSSIIQQSDKSSSEATISKMLDTKDIYVITKVISISDEKTSNSILKEAAVISSNQVEKQDLAVNILKSILEITPVTLKVIDLQILELIVEQKAAAEKSSSIKTLDFDKMGIIEKTLNLTIASAKNDQKNDVLEATEEIQKLFRKTGNVSPN
jgi:hypothetical protein